MNNKKRKIVVKFKDKKGLVEFSNKVGVACPKNTKTLSLPNKDIKLRQNTKKMNKPKASWQKEWVGMNDYNQENVKFYAVIDVFIEDSYVSKFRDIVDQTVTDRTKSMYYPEVKQGSNSALRYTSSRGNPNYPIYVVSKTRADNCVTANYLRDMGVPFYIVIEEHQYNDYAENFSEKHLLILEQKYLNEYITYDDLGDTKSKGPGAARNFAWNHSIENGHKWHWVMDDNIFGFYLLNDNKRVKSIDGGIFTAAEDFVSRYENLAITGLNYFMFAVPGSKQPAYVANTRIYSCLLIRNDIPYRWQGRYNEDTDISLRVMKDGWSTMQFNAFLCDKLCTQKMSGGNSEEFYASEGTYPKSKMLEDTHPDVAEVIFKFGRWHHIVDYSSFDKNGKAGIDEIMSKLYKMNIVSHNDEDIIDKIHRSDVFDDLYKDWFLKDVEPEKRQKIINELKRNKIVKKEDIQEFDYNFKKFRISEDDHKSHNDNVDYVYKHYLKKPEPEEVDLALLDILPHKTPSLEKVQQGIEEKKARELRDQIKKNKPKENKGSNEQYQSFETGVEELDSHKVLITGSETFTDKELFRKKINEYHNTKRITQIVNATAPGPDTMSIMWAF